MSISTLEALEIIRKRAQSCRQEGDSDMRNIIYLVDYLYKEIKENKSKKEILNALNSDDDED